MGLKKGDQTTGQTIGKKKGQGQGQTVAPDDNAAASQDPQDVMTMNPQDEMQDAQEPQVIQPDPLVGAPDKDKQLDLDEGMYDGEQDSSRKRHGQGVCIWNDGRRYDGQWMKGKRHGKGKMKQADGTILNGIWENDKFVISNQEQKERDERFSQNSQDSKHKKQEPYSERKQDQNLNGLIIIGFVISIAFIGSQYASGILQDDEWLYLMFSIVLMITFYGTLAFTIGTFCRDSQINQTFRFWQMLGLIVVNVLSGVSTVSSSYLGNQISFGMTIDQIKQAIRAEPVCTLKLENFQYVQHITVTSYDDGTKSESSNRVRELYSSHSQNLDMDYRQWKDESDPIQVLDEIEHLPAVRLRIHKKIRVEPSADKRVQRAKEQMVRKYAQWGKEKVFSENYDFSYYSNISDHTLIVNDSALKTKTWYLDKTNCFVLDLIFFGWIPRLNFNQNVRSVDFNIQKIVY